MPAQHIIHNQEKEQFVKLFKQDRIDRFNDRLAVLEVFLRSDHHVTVPELGALVRADGHDLDDGFVGATLELMCRYGFALANNFDNGKVRYEHRHLGQHHDHLICTKCQKIVEFENTSLERLQMQIAEAYGFHMLQHKLELYGICKECLAGREKELTLDAARSGEHLRVVGFSGGSQAKLRLLTMGLRIGDTVEVITNIHGGQVVVASGFNRLVLGQGLAHKIRVAPVTPGSTAGRSGQGSDP
ncbi:MAG: transcriptional repressor [Desulfatitalea sp.]|nr:transcriptional repressor [Desulfatitalea sp.]